MNEPISFLQMFTAPSFHPALILKLVGAVVTKGVIDLDVPRIWLRIHLENSLTDSDCQTLRESIMKSYGFVEADFEFENREEVSMRLNITSGIVYRARKVVIYGPEGIGKSTLARMFPNPLFTDTEGGTQYMNVQRTDPPTSWTMLLEIVKAIRDTPGVCQTWVLDTVDWAQKLCIRHICDKHDVNNLEDIPYGKGYVYIWEEFGQFLNLLDELIVRGIHVVVVAHSTTRPANQPEEFGNYDRYQLKLVDSKQNSNSDLLKEWCDLLLFCNYKTYAVATNKQGTKFKGQGSKRVMYTTRHACWDAKNRMNLPEELPLDYAPLAQYFDVAVPTSNPAPFSVPDSNSAPASAPAPASISASASVQSPAPAQASVSPPPPNQNAADRDMYFYHPESSSYWMLHKGESFPAQGIGTSEEISKEQFDAGLAQGSEPYKNPIPDPANSFDPSTRVDPATGELRPEAGPPAAETGQAQVVTAVNADPSVGRNQNGTYIDSGGQPLKKALQDFYPLMEMDSITAREVQAAIAQKGYFPADTPLANLPDDFIRGVLIGAWGQVKAVIEEMRADSDLPFTFGKEG